MGRGAVSAIVIVSLCGCKASNHDAVGPTAPNNNASAEARGADSGALLEPAAARDAPHFTLPHVQYSSKRASDLVKSDPSGRLYIGDRENWTALRPDGSVAWTRPDPHFEERDFEPRPNGGLVIVGRGRVQGDGTNLASNDRAAAFATFVDANGATTFDGAFETSPSQMLEGAQGVAPVGDGAWITGFHFDGGSFVVKLSPKGVVEQRFAFTGQVFDQLHVVAGGDTLLAVAPSYVFTIETRSGAVRATGMNWGEFESELTVGFPVANGGFLVVADKMKHLPGGRAIVGDSYDEKGALVSSLECPEVFRTGVFTNTDVVRLGGFVYVASLRTPRRNGSPESALYRLRPALRQSDESTCEEWADVGSENGDILALAAMPHGALALSIEHRAPSPGEIVLVNPETFRWIPPKTGYSDP
jgi:hypothetical protein